MLFCSSHCFPPRLITSYNICTLTLFIWTNVIFSFVNYAFSLWRLLWWEESLQKFSLLYSWGCLRWSRVAPTYHTAWMKSVRIGSRSLMGDSRMHFHTVLHTSFTSYAVGCYFTCWWPSQEDAQANNIGWWYSKDLNRTRVFYVALSSVTEWIICSTWCLCSVISIQWDQWFLLYLPWRTGKTWSDKEI